MVHILRRHVGLVQRLAVLLLIVAGLPGCELLDMFLGRSQDNLCVYRVIVVGVRNKKDKDTGKVTSEIISTNLGTAFLVNDKNLVVSNAHMLKVQDAEKVYVYLVAVDKSKGGGGPKKADVDFVECEILTVFNKGEEDLVLLRPKKTLAGHPIVLADYKPGKGSDVKALGYPGGADLAISSRVVKNVAEKVEQDKQLSKDDLGKMVLAEYVSELRKSDIDELAASNTQGVVSRYFETEGVPVVQHQAAINEGNSGGPLLDGCGSVVGINTYMPEGSQGIYMSLGSKWIAEKIRAAGHDVKFAGVCPVLSTQIQIYTSLAIVGILLSIATLVFAFRRTPAGQRGYTRLTRTRNLQGASAGSTRQTHAPQYAAGSGATILPGRTVLDKSGGGDGNMVRLVPTGAGRPLAFSVGRTKTPAGVILGRDHGNDGVIDDKTVSKRHARLTLDANGNLIIEDLSSSNGTWKNGTRISRDTFPSGALVRFGSAEFKIELPDSLGRGGHVGGGGGQIPGTVITPGARSESAILLSGIDGGGRPVQFSLQPGAGEQTWTIGRNAGSADFAVSHPRVSSVHARIRYRHGRGFEICDLGSSNGTKVDGRKVDREYVALEGARKILLGDFELNVNRG